MLARLYLPCFWNFPVNILEDILNYEDFDEDEMSIENVKLLESDSVRVCRFTNLTLSIDVAFKNREYCISTFYTALYMAGIPYCNRYTIQKQVLVPKKYFSLRIFSNLCKVVSYYNALGHLSWPRRQYIFEPLVSHQNDRDLTFYGSRMQDDAVCLAYRHEALCQYLHKQHEPFFIRLYRIMLRMIPVVELLHMIVFYEYSPLDSVEFPSEVRRPPSNDEKCTGETLLAS